MEWKKGIWPHVLTGVAAIVPVAGIVLGGAIYVGNSINAAEARLGDSINAAESRLGARIDKVEASIDAMRTDLQAYERNHYKEHLVVVDRLAKLEAVKGTNQ